MTELEIKAIFESAKVGKAVKESIVVKNIQRIKEVKKRNFQSKKGL